MKYFCAIIMFILFFPITFVFAKNKAVLPDIENKASMTGSAVCGEGSKGFTYKSDGYTLHKFVTPQGLFYSLVYSIVDADYFMKATSSSKLVKVAHLRWDQKLKDAAPNLYSTFHRRVVSDCVKKLHKRK